MRKIHILFILFTGCLLPETGIAQQKYALLVGINQYYTEPGKPYRSALRGCVNDAEAIRSVLVRRFGFPQENILLLSDESAGKQAVMDGFEMMLGKCKAGDAFVFYFSGHGVWMKNAYQSKLDEKVKQRMNQAMVMSNLYAKNLECLLTDQQVKRTFNRFIDKKVISTAILDCCFSGKIPMTYAVSPVNPYDPEFPKGGVEKSMPFLEILDNYASYKAEQTGAFDEDSLNVILLDSLNEEDKSFDMGLALNIRDSSHVTRPSERPASMFLSLGATDEYEKGLDIADETETYHGAYTAALLHVLKRNLASITVAELVRLTTRQMKLQQYPQTPLQFGDRQRLSKNLAGLMSTGFGEAFTVACVRNNGGSIILDAGLSDGVANDNQFQSLNKKMTLRVTGVTKHGATASLVIGDPAGVKPGDRFTLSSSVTKSKPLIKVFVAAAEITLPAFNAFLKKNETAGLMQMPNYRDYLNWDKTRSRSLFFSADLKTKSNLEPFLLGTYPEDHYVFLPVPAFIADPLNKILARNENIKVVSAPADADLVLYLNCTKAKAGSAQRYIFTWANLPRNEINDPGTLNFSKLHVSVANLSTDAVINKALALKIHSLLASHIRARTTHWLSNWPE